MQLLVFLCRILLILDFYRQNGFVFAQAPTYEPTYRPSRIPTYSPTALPSTTKPTRMPTSYVPTRVPVTATPTVTPTEFPTSNPTNSQRPTPAPTSYPTSNPSSQPSIQPSSQPSGFPTSQPSIQPTSQPSQPTGQPTSVPSRFFRPSSQPTSEPSVSRAPTRPTIAPTFTVTHSPTFRPTRMPTRIPSAKPTAPTYAPTTTAPSKTPTMHPTRQPTYYPTLPTGQPSSQPSGQPFSRPTSFPTSGPSANPTAQPTSQPTCHPTYSMRPTSQPSGQPSLYPSQQPSSKPTSVPTNTVHPSSKDTGKPSSSPSSQPSKQPTVKPSAAATPPVVTSPPTVIPTAPTFAPTVRPSSSPSGQPSSLPSTQPSSQPSFQPSSQPTSQPTQPTSKPTSRPSPKPSTAEPSFTPAPSVSMSPTSHPSSQPTSFPSLRPTGKPTAGPTVTWKPSYYPTSRPTSRPTCYPTAAWGQTLEPTALYSAIEIVGTVELQPALTTPCQTIALHISFTIERNLTAGSVLTINTPGITSGDCTAPRRGKPLSDMLIGSETANVHGRFVEGTVAKGFADSHIVLTFREDFLGAAGFQVLHSIHIDRFNNLKASCFSSENRTWDVYVTPLQMRGGLGGQLSLYGAYSSNTRVSRSICAAYTSSIAFDQPYPHFPTAVNLSFHFPQILSGSLDRPIITVYLPYFTNRAASSASSSAIHPYNAYMYNHRLTATGSAYLVNITASTKFAWTGTVSVSYDTTYFSSSLSTYTPRTTNMMSFASANDLSSITLQTAGENTISSSGEPTEASFTAPTPLFMKRMQSTFGVMKLTLTATGSASVSDAPEPFWIYVPAENRLTPVCGLQENSSHVQFEVFSQNFRVNQSRFDVVSGIGSACDGQTRCQGHGDCDYCAQQCICHDGFGSLSDQTRLQDGDQSLRGDCSSRVCPSGPSSFSMPRFDSGRSNTTSQVDLHRLVECSNNGVCDRDTGHCVCHNGFAGAACERTVCTSQCSEKGRCVSLQRLGAEPAALPISEGNRLKPNLYDDRKVYGMLIGAQNWDTLRGSVCVCDSSWAVGLDHGQTQLSEFFGPSCEYRRCPSGDDPDTPEDETDCEGRNQMPPQLPPKTFEELFTEDGFRREKEEVFAVGKKGNKCHIDCSNRGKCDYGTGICECFVGYTGHNCGIKK